MLMTNRERNELIASMVAAAKVFRRDGWECRRLYGLGKYDISAVASRGRGWGLMFSARMVKGLWTGARAANLERRAA
jgi:hypothetical protein